MTKTVPPGYALRALERAIAASSLPDLAFPTIEAIIPPLSELLDDEFFAVSGTLLSILANASLRASHGDLVCPRCAATLCATLYDSLIDGQTAMLDKNQTPA